MSKKILIILGHPDEESFCGSLAKAYAEGARSAGSEIKKLYLGNLKFDPILWHGYKKRQELELDLIKAQEDISWADHIVIIYPTWWGTMPALLKGFFDRVLLSGFAYKFKPNSPLWDKLLKGKTARLIVTMDGPSYYYKLYLCSAGIKIIKKGILYFCGIKPVKITILDDVKNRSAEYKIKWLNQINNLGAQTK